ncbi:MAG: hypothetical protein ABIQ02_04545, partial [Saprospiraceae bacterium]
GGYAVGVHGHPRYTGDLDIWINRSEANAQKMLICLTSFGFSFSGLEIDDFMMKEKVIQLGYPPLRIDILTDIEGVTFEEAYKNKSRFEIDDIWVDFISFQDLIKNKRATGRIIDLDDIENLEKDIE